MACIKGEYKKMMEHDEETYITAPGEDEDSDEDDKKKK